MRAYKSDMIKNARESPQDKTLVMSPKSYVAINTLNNHMSVVYFSYKDCNIEFKHQIYDPDDFLGGYCTHTFMLAFCHIFQKCTPYQTLNPNPFMHALIKWGTIIIILYCL